MDAPVIVQFGKREVISTGQFNIALVADKIIKDGTNTWLPLAEIAKFVYLKPHKPNIKRVRSYIWALRRELLRHGFLLIVDGRPAESVKIYDGSLEEDRQIVARLPEQLRKKQNFSAELYDMAMAILAPSYSDGQRQ